MLHRFEAARHLVWFGNTPRMPSDVIFATTLHSPTLPFDGLCVSSTCVTIPGANQPCAQNYVFIIVYSAEVSEWHTSWGLMQYDEK